MRTPITRRRLPLRAAVMAGLLVSVLGLAQASERILCDFESPQDVAVWSCRDLTSLELTQAWASHGKSAACLTYQQWAAGKEQWPAIVGTAPRKTLPLTDFSAYDELRFEVHNPGAQPAPIALHVRDAQESRFGRGYSVPPQATLKVQVAVSDLAGLVDVTQIREMHFYVTQPARTYTVYLDHVRLVQTLDVQAAALATDAAALERAAAEAQAEVGANVPPSLAAGLRLAQRVRVRAQLLARRLGSATPIGPETAAVHRAELAELRTQLTTAQAVGPQLQALRFARGHGGEAFALAVESPMTKVAIEAGRFASPFATSCALQAARNEAESLQVVVVPSGTDLARVTWQLAPLTHKTGRAIPATVRVVGYVDCGTPAYPVPRHGWWPDPLLDFMAEVPKVPAGEVLPLWVTVKVPADAPAGDYAGKLAVSTAGAGSQSVDLRLRVWDFVLPEHTHLKTALQLGGFFDKLYPGRGPEMKQKYEDWMLQEYHLNPGSIYGGPPSWDVARLKELKASGLNALNLCYVWASSGKDFKPEPFWAKFEQQMDAVAKYLPLVEAAGLRDQCYIYCFDERAESERDLVFQAAAKIKQRFPDIEVMTTAYDKRFGLDRPDGNTVDIWVPLTPHFDGNMANIEAARKAGRDIWWYICISPWHPFANWFVEYPAIEGRLLMGAMTAKYQPGGFLYYAVNRWPVNEKPISSGPRTDWNPASYKNNNGDGSIMCAGPDGPLATIRLENIRDGLEDYEYYYRLRELLAQRGRATIAGQVPESVVKNLTSYTSDPTVLLAERQRVAEAILRLQGK